MQLKADEGETYQAENINIKPGRNKQRTRRIQKLN